MDKSELLEKCSKEELADFIISKNADMEMISRKIDYLTEILESKEAAEESMKEYIKSLERKIQELAAGPLLENQGK